MLEDELLSETKKWLKKAEEKRKTIKNIDDNALKNIDAYISDSRHFLEKNDLIRAFEAIIWAWAWMEIMEHWKNKS